MAEIPKKPTTPNKTGKIVAISAVVVGVGIGLYFLLTANRASAQRPTRTQPTPAKKTGGIADVLSKLFAPKKGTPPPKGGGAGGGAPKGSSSSGTTKPKPTGTTGTKPEGEEEEQAGYDKAYEESGKYSTYESSGQYSGYAGGGYAGGGYAGGGYTASGGSYSADYIS